MVLAQALFDVKVYIAADKYGLPELQQQAADVFGSSLFCASSSAPATTTGNGVSGAGGAGGGKGGRGAGQQQQQQQQQPLTPAALTQIIDEVYNGVAAALPHDRVLRDIVSVVLSYEINALMREPRFVALLEGRDSGVAADAAKSLAQRLHPEQKRYLCPHCGRHFETVIPIHMYYFQCFNCPRSLDGKEWAKNVVSPDLSAMWREHQQKRKN
jgi:ribosomal protein L37AE/L43A